ncbi:MAG: O-antigen ligase family protein [Oscillospiraceae bacterium]|nr:O-antigen ligase family protein [Oscillospiraceae bacterium]
MTLNRRITIPYAALFVIVLTMYFIMDTIIRFPYKSVLRWVFPAMLLLAAGLENGKRFVLLPNAAYLFMLMYFAVTILLCSPVRYYSTQRLISLVLVVGMHATYYSLLRNRHRLDRAVVYIGMISVAYGIVNFLFLGRTVSGRSVGITGNANSLGHEANISLLFSIYFFAKSRRRDKLIWILLMLTNTVSAFLSGSRTAFVLLVINYLYFFLEVSQIRRKWMPTTIAILLLLTGFLLPREILLQVPGLDRLIIQGTDRGELWEYAWRVFLNKPLLGHGYGAVNTTTSIKVAEGMGYHSSYLTVLVETGVIGLLCVSAFVLPVIIKAGKEWLLTRSTELGTMLVLSVSFLLSFYGESSMTSVGSTEGFLFWGAITWLMFRVGYTGDRPYPEVASNAS